MRIVPVESLNSEMQLAKPLYYNNNILLNTGAIKLQRYKERLLKLGINYLYVKDNYSRNLKINELIKDKTRKKSRAIIKKTLDNIAIHEDINISEIKSLIIDIIDDILSLDNILLNLIDIKTYSSYTFTHSVNVAVISVLIGKLLNYELKSLIDLGIGGLLHDIGKVLLPPKILNKPNKLSREEYKILKEHPRLGYDYTKKYDEISKRASMIILSHHERIDGSGYPKKISGNKIHDFSKIAAIADVYDALISDRIYRKSWSMTNIIEYLISNVNTKFDFEILEIFIENIAIYPNGNTVLLSNGQRAVVKEQNKGFPLRPIVVPIVDKEGKEIRELGLLNLMETLDIVILDNL
ncbi:HD-GYP domain-containing protein [Natronospora cellulosivora (SeqCode)]